MNALEKVCLQLCEEIFNTSSVTDKTVLSYSVKFKDNAKTVEVILVTKEDEYTFVLDLPEEEIYSEIDTHVYQCSKCASENKYKLKRIKIKGFDVVEFGKVDLRYLKVILEKLADDHARCIEENNSEKKIYKTGFFSVSEFQSESFSDVLCKVLYEVNRGNIDKNVFLQGIKTIEKSYEALIKSHKEYVFVYGNILQKKLFVKRTEKCLCDYKILNIRTEQNFPLVYDLLLTIFSFSDQYMRQHYFHELLDHYYKSLGKSLQKFCLDITKCLPLPSFQKQILEFTPHVKLDILRQLCKVFTKEKRTGNGKPSNDNQELQKALIWTSILELNECIIYPNLTREDCYKILKNKLGSSDYKLLNYRLIPLAEREGYLGEYFKLKIEIERKGEVELLHLFAKYLPTYNDMALDLARESFQKEEFYYLTLIPELNEHGLEDITDFLPKCYFSRTSEVLIFEDMFEMNYKTFSVSVVYDYEMLLMTIKQQAKMHACSILYEEILSEQSKEVVRFDTKFPEYVEEKNILNHGKTLSSQTLLCAIRTFIEMLGAFPDIPKEFSMEEFKKRAQYIFDLCFEKVKKSDKFRNVVCQGDAWASNILFQIDKDKLPIDCKIVDYQLTRYCVPAHDLYVLLYMATTKEIRQKFESKLLKEYYWELSIILQRHGVDLEKIYTYQQFLDSCKYMRSQSLCQAIIVLQFVLFPEEKLRDILQDKEAVSRLFYVNRDIFVEELKYGGPYSKRMKELAEELYEISLTEYE